MLRQATRSAGRVTLLVLAAAAAVFSEAPLAQAAGSQLKPIVITPSSGCSLLTPYTAGPGLPAWSSPAPPCGTGPFTMAFNQGSTAPVTTTSGSRGIGMAGSALLAWFASVPDGARMGYRITAPPGITITNVDYDVAQLQNIADGHGWIGLTYSNSGVKQVHSPGTATDAAASGPLNTNYWGIDYAVSSQSARCQESSSSVKSRCPRQRRSVLASRRWLAPATCGAKPVGSGTRRGMVGPSPCQQMIRRACVA
jgi:hypothetical protein